MLMRTLFIAGNWKMNPGKADEAVALAEAVKAGVGQATDVRVAVCPPYPFLARVDEALSNTPIGLGAQDASWEASGAFTGEVSCAMLLDAGCTHVILGHSERRHILGEGDAWVNKKLKAVLAAGLIPIVCIGETLAERQADQTEAVVDAQLTGSLAGLSPEQMAGVVLAYEPVWAIGTGLTATPEQAQTVHEFVRKRLTDTFGAAIAGRVVIQYGGSVNGENAGKLLSCPDIDGALVGGASLKAPEFLKIIAAGQAVTAAGKTA